jgi:hypothetical protein
MSRLAGHLTRNQIDQLKVACRCLAGLHDQSWRDNAIGGHTVDGLRCHDAAHSARRRSPLAPFTPGALMDHGIGA